MRTPTPFAGHASCIALSCIACAFSPAFSHSIAMLFFLHCRFLSALNQTTAAVALPYIIIDLKNFDM